MSQAAADHYQRVIWPRLIAGEDPVVGVCRDTAGFHVEWGVAGERMLVTTAEGARDLAEELARHAVLPSLVELLRLAADVCDAKNAPGATRH